MKFDGGQVDVRNHRFLPLGLATEWRAFSMLFNHPLRERCSCCHELVEEIFDCTIRVDGIYFDLHVLLCRECLDVYKGGR